MKIEKVFIMADIWEAICNAVSAFFDWFLHQTPLFGDTLNTVYVSVEKMYETYMPLIAEYIKYITEYVQG